MAYPSTPFPCSGAEPTKSIQCVNSDGSTANTISASTCFVDWWLPHLGQTYIVIPDSIITPTVPESVPMLNAHLALIAAGKMDLVTSSIAGMNTTDQQAANAYLNLAQTCRRDNALVAQLGPLIGLDSAGLDQLFISAAAINP